MAGLRCSVAVPICVGWSRSIPVQCVKDAFRAVLQDASSASSAQSLCGAALPKQRFDQQIAVRGYIFSRPLAN